MQMGEAGIRKANINDVEKIHKLINDYAEKSIMLPRSLSMLYESLRDFLVAEHNGEVIGTGALHIVWNDLAELRGLAIDPGYIGRGLGTQLVNALIDEARQLGIPRIFALTYSPAFFEKFKFQLVPKEQLPQKVWRDCINCPKFPNCDEIALIKTLSAGHHPSQDGSLEHRDEADDNHKGNAMPEGEAE